jgi:prepilin peptidase CpaA
MIALTINYIFIAIFSALIIFAAIEDVRRLIIPNWIPASILVLFILSVFVGYISGSSIFSTSIWANLLTFTGALAFFTILFATGQMGGGDVKLIATVSLWAGPYLVLDFIIITALVGGIIAAVQLVRGGQIIQTDIVEESVGDTSATQQLEPTTHKAVPYGLAIGFGGLYCAQQLFNQLN